MVATASASAIYINTGVSDCYQQRMVQTRHGMRLRTVNVCAYASTDRTVLHMKTPVASAVGVFIAVGYSSTKVTVSATLARVVR